MTNKEIFRKILSAKSEADVENIIKNNPSIFNIENWLPVADIDNNLGVIEPQGKNPERALIEKVTNSIDAILLKKCVENGIDPKSNEAPQTIHEALERFFSIQEGDLSDLPKDKKDRLASQIYVIAEGLVKKQANFYVIDKGIGQNPSNFKDTFLKFGGNKIDINFVHGRFGTGSFGVLPNSGENKYQLILSKESSEWGWTLIRKSPGDDQKKHRRYEYITDQGSIFSFSESNLGSLIRDSIEYEKLDIKDFKRGTLIKLYNYDLASSSDVDRDLSKAFNRYLFSPALPFRILDAQTKSNVGPGKEIDGNLNRLRKNIQQIEGENKIRIQKVNLPRLGEVDIDIYVSKYREGKKTLVDSENFTTKDEAVFFIRNGQSHGELPRSFIRDDVGLHHIYKDVAIYIDCTNNSHNNFDDVFSPTRDAPRDNRHRKAVEDALRKELKDLDILKELNNKRRINITEESIPKRKDFAEFMNKLYENDPALRKLLAGNLNIANLSKASSKGSLKFEGSYIPTFFEIHDKEVKNNKLKNIPVNSFVKVAFSTDAKDDYLYRDKDNGDLVFDYDGKVNSYKLHNGQLTLKISPPDDALEFPDNEANFKVSLTRPYQPPLTQSFKVRFTEPVDTIIKPSSKKEKNKKTKEMSLPEMHIISGNEWVEKYGYDKNNLCELEVEKSESGKYLLKEVNINDDFSDFKSYLKFNNYSENRITTMKEQFVQSVYVSSIIVHKDFADEHMYDHDKTKLIINNIGRSLPFVLFTMQKR